MKTAYPFDASNPSGQQRTYNLSSWMDAMKKFYIELHYGKDEKSALESVAKSWDTVEKRDFQNWLKYYQSGDYLKYKTAQQKQNKSVKYYMNDDIPGYFLPNPENKKVPEIFRSNEEDNIINIVDGDYLNNEDHLSEKEKEEQKRFTIEEQRKKLLGRLSSIEKLLASPDGHLFSGAEFEVLLKSIYELKHQIATMNKISVSSKIYCDLIIRQANILNANGCSMGAKLLSKFAQNVPSALINPTPATSEINTGVGLNNSNSDQFGKKEPKSEGKEDASKLSTPAASGSPPPNASSSSPPAVVKEDDAVSEFLDNLKEIENKKDENSSNDNDFNDYIIDGTDERLNDAWTGNLDIIDNGDEKYNDFQNADDVELVVEAQALPAQTLPTKKDIPAVEKKPVDSGKDNGKLEVSETDKIDPLGGEGKQAKDFDVLLDQVFQDLTINDVIEKLEQITNIFKNREISRQLALIDIMLDRLGIATYFSQLSEAINKNLDANNYVESRLSTILSQLKGAVKTKDIKLSPDENKILNPETQKVKNVLENDEQKEQERKELRKSVEDAKLDNSLKQPLEVDNATKELNNPAPIENKIPTNSTIPK